MHEGELAEQMAAEIQAAGELSPHATSSAHSDLVWIAYFKICKGMYMHFCQG
jgi:hypothetical protein